MSTLLRFLLISISILYLIRLLARYLLPIFFQNLVNKAQQSQQQTTNRPNHNPTGRIKIDHIPESVKTKIPDTEGDFVEYEEVKK